ncbi:hypothetical protein LCGC14_1570980 [marine sediment metagenome]|uniref:30S ribosomal protein S6 n=1 Tax=marine sediment metagenome TaxID=412755 RepID=A0A0F9IJT0_9ZZZZ
MRSYELMLVTPTSLSKDQEGEFFSKTEATIKKNKGKVTSKTPMGKKKLAYQISGQNEGIYTLLEFDGDGKTVSELEMALKISGEVLRYGVFKLEKKEKKNGKLK